MNTSDTMLKFIREFYKVPAELGRRVSCLGRDGTIVGAKGSLIQVEMDYDGGIDLYHPQWKIEYHDEVIDLETGEPK